MCPNAHAECKIRICLKTNMRNSLLQINETSVNESFKSINGFFEEFQTFSSNLFLQIMDGITLMLENFLK